MGLSGDDRVRLRWASFYGPTRSVRLRSAVLILLDDGWRVGPVARSVGVSRPTVYQWVRVFRRWRRPEALDTIGITRRDRQIKRMEKTPLASTDASQGGHQEIATKAIDK